MNKKGGVDMDKLSIGFIGTGVMGGSIVKHLLAAGHKVTVYTRSKHKAMPLIEAGANWADTPAQVAKSADVVMTMVGYPSDVEEVYYGDEGIFQSCKEGQIVIDLTTSSPSLAKRIAKDAAEKGMSSLDAPVSGGDIGAQNGTLSIMCGGDEKTFEHMLPLLQVFGKQIVYQGEAGAGQHSKMSNQIAIATNMIGVCEALIYAKRAGLDANKVLQSISSGAAGSWSLSNLSPRMLKGDFEPGFFVKHFLKDMKIALKEAEEMSLPLPGLRLAKEMYEELVNDGYGDKGTQVLFQSYER
ncbi:NAD(P)-dependent oxidoreductase [Sporosarcina sp. USHLN248]|uniref:NAD(P)-dependent oxidoreductase n=1 Tax=Sporosarcina sp. USHLN248 TaxID=3081300 RepID=UPI003015C777